MNHVYIHIPFCKSICSYCDFCKMYYDKNLSREYLSALKREIDEYYMGEEVSTLYIGGGTPSSLDYEELELLHNIIKTFKLSDNYEFTFECNPDDLTENFVRLISKMGVNRVSIGVQSFNKDKLKFMERDADPFDIKIKMGLLRYYGINNINLDLMYGIPGETLDMLKKDVKQFIRLNPEHISTYSLIIEEHTKINNESVTYIDEDLEYKMYEYICKKLKGYHHYEVSNFALEGKESKHNLAYWNNEEYYGFGLGASGYMNGFRYQNTRNLNDYKEGNYRAEEALLSKQEIMDYELMLGFRKLEGINLQEFFDKYEVNMQELYPIKPLVKNKDLKYKNGYVFINPDKIYVMNEILNKMI